MSCSWRVVNLRLDFITIVNAASTMRMKSGALARAMSTDSVDSSNSLTFAESGAAATITAANVAQLEVRIAYDL